MQKEKLINNGCKACGNSKCRGEEKNLIGEIGIGGKIGKAENHKRGYILLYLVGIAVPLLVGLLSAFITKDYMISYEELEKPPLAPAAWIFPVVWTILYILMGISSASVILRRNEENMQTVRAL